MTIRRDGSFSSSRPPRCSRASSRNRCSSILFFNQRDEHVRAKFFAVEKRRHVLERRGYHPSIWQLLRAEFRFKALRSIQNDFTDHRATLRERLRDLTFELVVLQSNRRKTISIRQLPHTWQRHATFWSFSAQLPEEVVLRRSDRK